MICLEHPEVRALSVAIDWAGALNDAKIAHGVWVNRDGPVLDLAGIVGSGYQTLKMLDIQLGRAMEYATNLRNDIARLAQERLTLVQENQRSPAAPGNA